MKTPKEFDYDLWRGKNGECFIKIKRTGEICEVNLETFRLLRNESMRIYRSYKGTPVYAVENGKSILCRYTSTLSLEYTDIDDKSNDVLLSDKGYEENIVLNISIQEFCESLTKKVDIFIKCIIQGDSASCYAVENGVSKAFVSKYMKKIREKAKNFF